MPLYQYRCPNDECPIISIGLLRKVSDRDNVTFCPECEAQLKRELSAPAFKIDIS